MMLRVLLCAVPDARFDLHNTMIGRSGIEVYRASRMEDARLLASTLNPQVIFLDRDFPKVQSFLADLRQDPATQKRSLAILALGEMQPIELELLEAGANAILRLPPDHGWDDRLAKLLVVPTRHEARLVVHFSADTSPECAAAILNLSAGGMLLATDASLAVNDELSFRFKLPDGSRIEGRARIAREAPPTGYGAEFVEISGAARESIRQFLRSSRLG